MREMGNTIDRLEARIDLQAARIDALYEILERNGISPRPATGSGDAPSVEPVEVRAARSNKRRKTPPRSRRAAGFHLGTATGV